MMEDVLFSTKTYSSGQKNLFAESGAYVTYERSQSIIKYRNRIRVNFPLPGKIINLKKIKVNSLINGYIFDFANNNSTNLCLMYEVLGENKSTFFSSLHIIQKFDKTAEKSAFNFYQSGVRAAPFILQYFLCTKNHCNAYQFVLPTDLITGSAPVPRITGFFDDKDFCVSKVVSLVNVTLTLFESKCEGKENRMKTYQIANITDTNNLTMFSDVTLPDELKDKNISFKDVYALEKSQFVIIFYNSDSHKIMAYNAATSTDKGITFEKNDFFSQSAEYFGFDEIKKIKFKGDFFLISGIGKNIDSKSEIKLIVLEINIQNLKTAKKISDLIISEYSFNDTSLNFNSFATIDVQSNDVTHKKSLFLMSISPSLSSSTTSSSGNKNKLVMVQNTKNPFFKIIFTKDEPQESTSMFSGTLKYLKMDKTFLERKVIFKNSYSDPNYGVTLLNKIPKKISLDSLKDKQHSISNFFELDGPLVSARLDIGNLNVKNTNEYVMGLSTVHKSIEYKGSYVKNLAFQGTSVLYPFEDNMIRMEIQYLNSTDNQKEWAGARGVAFYMMSGPQDKETHIKRSIEGGAKLPEELFERWAFSNYDKRKYDFYVYLNSPNGINEVVDTSETDSHIYLAFMHLHIKQQTSITGLQVFFIAYNKKTKKNVQVEFEAPNLDLLTCTIKLAVVDDQVMLFILRNEILLNSYKIDYSPVLNKYSIEKIPRDESVSTGVVLNNCKKVNLRDQLYFITLIIGEKNLIKVWKMDKKTYQFTEKTVEISDKITMNPESFTVTQNYELMRQEKGKSPKIELFLYRGAGTNPVFDLKIEEVELKQKSEIFIEDDDRVFHKFSFCISQGQIFGIYGIQDLALRAKELYHGIQVWDSKLQNQGVTKNEAALSNSDFPELVVHRKPKDSALSDKIYTSVSTLILDDQQEKIVLDFTKVSSSLLRILKSQIKEYSVVFEFASGNQVKMPLSAFVEKKSIDYARWIFFIGGFLVCLSLLFILGWCIYKKVQERRKNKVIDMGFSDIRSTGLTSNDSIGLDL